MCISKLKRIINFPKNDRFGETEVLCRGKETDSLIAKLIESNKPFFISRLGGFELDVCCEAYYIKHFLKKGFNSDLRQRIMVNAGVFPNSNIRLLLFSNTYKKSVKNVSVFAVWKTKDFESFFIKKYSKCRTYIPWKSLFPGINNWTTSLAGKKVLVVSPFVKSINEQYKKRKQIYSNNLLPSFDLSTYKPVVSHGGGSHDGYKNWHKALKKMCKEISLLDFDVCLLGCGAYGLPLGAYIHKKLLKQVIHVGGSLQLLFGIIGHAYESDNEIKKLINGYWVYPRQDETPLIAKDIEDRCYWK